MTPLADRSARVDEVVLATARDCLPETGLALLAVGGYGRRELFPYSDVDLLLLFESEHLAHANKEGISGFLQRLWDSGLRVSHSVRTISDCAEVHDDNAELNVSLLDQRYLIGDAGLYAQLTAVLPRFIHRNREALTRNLARLARERHAKYAGTFYHLEPNVKEGPGGLRDYQLIRWLEQLHRNGGSPAPELEEAFSYLADLRSALHHTSGRDDNVLSFAAQDMLAERSGEPDPARWMRGYYRRTRDVYRAAIRALDGQEARNSSLLAQFRDWRSRLSNAEFSVHRDRVHFRAPHQLESDPELALRLFEFIARHDIRPSFEAEQRIAAQIDSLRAWFAAPQSAWAALRRILALPHAPSALRAMHETGVLTAAFPELEHIECLVVRDFYHRYTVDEHSLVAIQNLWSVPQPFRDLLDEIEEPAVLAFALLFHDSGKGMGGGHVEASVAQAEPAMARIGMPPQESETVRFLIARHLDLSGAMQTRDLFDPQTARDLALQVETVEQLKALTLLTYADVSAVNPGAMTEWRAAQLWQLYLKVYNELTRSLETERIEPSPAGPPERADFLSGFPVRYLRTHTEAEIAGHMDLETRSRKRGVAVDVRRFDSAWQLTLIANDRPGLFAAAAGALASFGMNILRAEAFANRRGLVLDTFAFADPHRTLDLNPSEVDRLRVTMERAILGKADVKTLLRNRPKPVLPSRSARSPARVRFNPEAGSSATLIEVVAEDRPGLLYDLASAISAHGANIEVVLIDTQAHKAIDVFYVTSNGGKLGREEQELLGEDLRAALN